MAILSIFLPINADKYMGIHFPISDYSTTVQLQTAILLIHLNFSTMIMSDNFPQNFKGLLC